MSGPTSRWAAMDVWVDRACGSAAGLASVGIVGIMILTVADVVSRKYLDGGVRGTVEVTEVVLAAIVFLGLASAERSGRHIRTPIVTSRLPVQPANIARVVGTLTAVVVMAWISYGAIAEAWRSWDRREFRYGSLNLDVWPTKIAIAVGLVLLLVALALRLRVQMTDLAHRRDASIEAELESIT